VEYNSKQQQNSAEELSSMVLVKMRETAEQYLNKKIIEGVGGSRESELQAMNAIGNEDEKRRDLQYNKPQEVHVLASLDR
jgi:hypothetical protein